MRKPINLHQLVQQKGTADAIEKTYQSTSARTKKGQETQMKKHINLDQLVQQKGTADITEKIYQSTSARTSKRDS